MPRRLTIQLRASPVRPVARRAEGEPRRGDHGGVRRHRRRIVLGLIATLFLPEIPLRKRPVRGSAVAPEAMATDPATGFAKAGAQAAGEQHGQKEVAQ